MSRVGICKHMPMFEAREKGRLWDCDTDRQWRLYQMYAHEMLVGEFGLYDTMFAMIRGICSFEQK